MEKFKIAPALSSNVLDLSVTEGKKRNSKGGGGEREDDTKTLPGQRWTTSGLTAEGKFQSKNGKWEQQVPCNTIASKT